MYIIKNAVKNIGRNKGRNLLMGIIIFAILLTSAVAIMINSTTKEIIEDYKSRFGAEVSLDINWTKWQNTADQENIEWLTAQQYLDFGKSDLLQRADFIATMMVAPQGITALSENQGNSSAGGLTPSIGGAETISPNATVLGFDNPEDDTEFQNETRKIIDGRFYTDKNECIISCQLAELNALSVGDVIKINSCVKNSPMTIEVTIVGIFEDHTMVGASEYQTPLSNRNNEILVSLNTALEAEMFQTVGYVEASYYLKNPDDAEAFEKELKAKGLTDYYKVRVDESGYEKIVAPVEGMTKITRTFLTVVLILGSIVLIVLSTMVIRERKYEIGVLRAMGMKKIKVALGLMTEMIVITALCLCLGLGVGSVVAQPVADNLLDNQIRIAEENSNSVNYNAVGNDSNVTALTEVDIHLGGESIAQIALIALLLTTLSSVGGIAYITRFEPRKILSERS